MRKLLLTAAAALIAGSIAAFAANTVFFTNLGDITFPFSPPTAAGGAGAIDNMVIGATTPRAGSFTNVSMTGQTCVGTPCTDQGVNAAQGGTIIQRGGASSTSANAGGPSQVIGGAPGATGVGGAAQVIGGAGGATSGAGGAASVTGGAGTAGNGNGGDANISGGAANGSGVAGLVRVGSVLLVTQGAPGSQDTAATLTAAQILAGIVTSAPAAAINLQLPLATAMDTALPTSGAGDAFDFSLINTSTTAANTDTLTTNTGWTLVGNVIVPGLTAGPGTSGRFRARKTGTGAWTLYRL